MSGEKTSTSLRQRNPTPALAMLELPVSGVPPIVSLRAPAGFLFCQGRLLMEALIVTFCPTEDSLQQLCPLFLLLLENQPGQGECLKLGTTACGERTI